jgi:hypothetical protein
MNTLVGVVCNAYFIARFFPAPLGTVWQTATVDDMAGPTSRVDHLRRNDARMILAYCDVQRCRRMTLAPYSERPLGAGRIEYLKQYLLERYFRDTLSGTVTESHLEALNDMIALSVLETDPRQEDA